LLDIQGVLLYIPLTKKGFVPVNPNPIVYRKLASGSIRKTLRAREKGFHAL